MKTKSPNQTQNAVPFVTVPPCQKSSPQCRIANWLLPFSLQRFDSQQYSGQHFTEIQVVSFQLRCQPEDSLKKSQQVSLHHPLHSSPFSPVTKERQSTEEPDSASCSTDRRYILPCICKKAAKHETGSYDISHSF